MRRGNKGQNGNHSAKLIRKKRLSEAVILRQSKGQTGQSTDHRRYNRSRQHCIPLIARTR